MSNDLQEIRRDQRELMREMRELAQSLNEHMSYETSERAELKVSLARLETKVAVHDKGLSALGALFVAAIGSLVTNLFFRWLK